MAPSAESAVEFVLKTLRQHADRELQVADLHELASGAFTQANLLQALGRLHSKGLIVKAIEPPRAAWWAIAPGTAQAAQAASQHTSPRRAQPNRAPVTVQLPPFVAMDFETADYGPDSACAIGLVRVENGTIVQRATRLIRPPRRQFVWTHVHGITWKHVQNEPHFAEVWREVAHLLTGIEFLVAHNASFDRRVLQACCDAAGLAMPDQPFRCTVQLAKRTWSLPSNSLDKVCHHLKIPLQHHEAGSDAEACARIVLHAHEVQLQRAAAAVAAGQKLPKQHRPVWL